jgi:hypothetical protein
MLIGGIIAGILLPWVLLAPTIPLLLILIKRNQASKTMVVLAMLCVVSILSNIFLLMASGSGLQNSFLRVSFLAELLFTGMLLKYCTEHLILRYSIVASILIFGSVYVTFISLSPEGNIRVISMIGVVLIFIISILVLFSKMNKLDQNIIMNPDFWFTGGIFFHFGLLSLLLFTGKKITDLDYHSQDDFSILYVIIFVIQFLFFAAGILVQKPWNNKN